MQTLQKELSDISFVSREKKNGKTVPNKCGRDFLYYALHFLLPDNFNSKRNNPIEIDEKNLFGIRVSPFFSWTQFQFIFVAKLLKKHGLRLVINDKRIKNYFALVSATLFARKNYEQAIKEIEESVDTNSVCGVDISLGIFGLLDHVLFVYGYDDENLYVFDTHKVPYLEYEPLQDHNYFKLPKSIVKKRWTRFGRVWKVISE